MIGDRIQVLLVEDNAGDARLVHEIRSESANDLIIHTATTLKEGIQYLESPNHTDIILADLNLPDSKGLNTFLHLHTRYPNIPVVILTGSDERELALQAVKEGAQDYIFKGDINGRYLIRVLDNAIERSRLVLALEAKNLALQAARDGLEAEVASRVRELQEERDKAHLYLDVVDVIIVALNVHGKITMLNHKGYKVFGYEEDELVGKDWFETCLSEESKQKTRSFFNQMIAGKVAPNKYFENTILTKSGEKRVIAWHTATLKNESGVVIGAIGSGEDITQRRRVEQALTESEERNRLLLDGAGLGIGYYDLDGNCLLMNQKACESMQMSREEILGRNAVDLFGEWMGGVMLDRITQVSKQDRFMTYEDQVDMPEGKRWFFSTYARIKNLSNQILGVQIISEDITERKQVSEELIKRNQFIETILDNLPIGLAVNFIDDGNASYINAEFEKIYGWPKEILKDVENFFRVVYPDPDYRRQVQGRILADIQSGEPERMLWDGIEITTQKGEKRIVTAKNIPLYEQNLMISTVQDMTEQNRAESALRQSETLLKASQQLASVGGWEYDLATQEMFWTDEVYRIHGISADDIDPGNTEHIHVSIKCYDHGDRPIVYGAFQRCIEQGESYNLEFPFTAMDGQRKWIHTTGRAIIENNHVVKVIGIIADITDKINLQNEVKDSSERIRALANYQQTAIEAERTRIAREIHDEFGQMLTAMKMDLSWLERHTQLTSIQRERLHATDQLVDEAIKIIRRIASELRPGVLDDLGLVAALEWQAQDFSRRSEIPCDISLPDEYPVLNRELSTALFRIFQEALTNISRYAKASAVKASLTVNEIGLWLQISDDGSGVDQSDIQNPKSFGLLGMMERAALWGGNIEITGKKGLGTTVKVFIPSSSFQSNQHIG